MSQTETQRLFFALNPPPDIRRQIDHARVQMGVVDARPVPVENLHITLVFLGRVEHDQLEPLLGVMSQVNPPACDLCLERCGWFRRARVGWIGSGSIPGEAVRFQHTLNEAIASLGFELDDRDWTPHVTVYRKMRTRPVMLQFEPIRWRLDSYDLMVSEQRPGGVQYRSIGHRVANG